MLTALLLCGCAGGGSNSSDGSSFTAESVQSRESAQQSGGVYEQITQEEAKKIMSEQSDYILLDVRMYDEFDEGHIPGAICIPNEMITDKEVPQLPDKDRLILVYCRSGRRSKEAAQKLADIGYTNVKEFGGIITWNGEVTTSL